MTEPTREYLPSCIVIQGPTDTRTRIIASLCRLPLKYCVSCKNLAIDDVNYLPLLQPITSNRDDFACQMIVVLETAARSHGECRASQQIHFQRRCLLLAFATANIPRRHKMRDSRIRCQFDDTRHRAS